MVHFNADKIIFYEMVKTVSLELTMRTKGTKLSHSSDLHNTEDEKLLNGLALTLIQNSKPGIGSLAVVSINIHSQIL